MSSNVTINSEKQVLLIRAERLKAIREMASSIAHELNQPLSGIRAFAENLLISIEKKWEVKDDEIKHKMSRIIEQVDRMSEFIEHLHDLSNNEQEESVINAYTIIKASIQMIAAKFKSRGIALKFPSESKELFIKVNPFKIEEAIRKLLYNSLDAIENFTVDRYDLPKSVVISLKTTDSKIIIEITDTGGGIEQNILENIFDPFFTTKSNGKKLGLGLTIAKQIIEECNGDLQIISNLGIGTTAFLTLPLYKKNV
ncbi:MAG: hypothetical protein HQK79_17325 [Desulfobacterales bacterium]|nr:hypothetical protein [Desulfobacterales bacterium]